MAEVRGADGVTHSFSVHSSPQDEQCVSCMVVIDGDEVLAPCGHHYDQECILRLFETAMKDESLFPPRCCGKPVPLASVRPYMSDAEAEAFTARTKELGTSKRVYCANPACSRFLGAQFDSVSAIPSLLVPTLKCSECGTSTCARCKAAITPLPPGPQDDSAGTSSGGNTASRDTPQQARTRHRCAPAPEADATVLALAKRTGWARCPGCANMVELTHGCFHMTCRCGTQFCYACSARWRTCSCPRWNETRLTEPRDPPQRILPPPPWGRPRPPPQDNVRARAPMLRRAARVRTRPTELPLQAYRRQLPVVEPDGDLVAALIRDGNRGPPAPASGWRSRLWATVPEEDESEESFTGHRYLPPTPPPGQAVVAAPGLPQRSTPKESAVSTPALRPWEMEGEGDTANAHAVAERRLRAIPAEAVPPVASTSRAVGWHIVPLPEQQAEGEPSRLRGKAVKNVTLREELTLRWIKRQHEDAAGRNCAHEEWTFYRGEGACDMCTEHVEEYFYVSTACIVQHRRDGGAHDLHAALRRMRHLSMRAV